MKLNSNYPIILALIILLSGCNTTTESKMKPPIAKKIPKELINHGHKRIDNYYWLNERENPEVIAYLEAENSYTQEVMKSTEELQNKIYDEIVGRIKQNDVSVPYFYNGYSYYTKYDEGKEYPIFCRKSTELNSQEEVFINGNILAEGHAYFNLGAWAFSTNNKLLAYSTDTVSRRKYDIYFLNIETNKKLQSTSMQVY